MNATNEPTIVIHESNDGKIFHWQILDEQGNEFQHSAYHADRATCEKEAADKLALAKSQGWL